MRTNVREGSKLTPLWQGLAEDVDDGQVGTVGLEERAQGQPVDDVVHVRPLERRHGPSTQRSVPFGGRYGGRVARGDAVPGTCEAGNGGRKSGDGTDGPYGVGSSWRYNTDGRWT